MELCVWESTDQQCCLTIRVLNHSYGLLWKAMTKDLFFPFSSEDLCERCLRWPHDFSDLKLLWFWLLLRPGLNLQCELSCLNTMREGLYIGDAIENAN